MREGVLIIPTDSDKSLTLLSFFTQSVILPPGGEPMLVDDIWQIGAIGREYADRAGSSTVKTAEACASMLSGPGLANGQIGWISDRTGAQFYGYLASQLPKAKFVADNGIIDRMQKIRSPREIFRAAAQLISIGTQAAYHVTRPGVTDAEIYAAFSWAQLARGGETGDGYHIGINQYGTHCGKPYGHVVRRGDLINLYISNVTYTIAIFVAQRCRDFIWPPQDFIPPPQFVQLSPTSSIAASSNGFGSEPMVVTRPKALSHCSVSASAPAPAISTPLNPTHAAP